MEINKTDINNATETTKEDDNNSVNKADTNDNKDEADKKQKLLKVKTNIENKIKKLQGRLKLINQELTNIELQEKSKSADEIIKLLGVGDTKEFIELIKAGKVNISNQGDN